MLASWELTSVVTRKQNLEGAYMRVLVVEDEPGLAETVCESLSAHGFAPVKTLSATEAYEALWSHPIDLIVLDIMLPEGNDAGFELAERIREAGFRQPILFLTARDLGTKPAHVIACRSG